MQTLEFFLHRMNRLGQPGNFRQDLVGADRVMSDLEGGMRNELRAPDGDVLAQTYVRAGESYVVPAGIAYRVIDAR